MNLSDAKLIRATTPLWRYLRVSASKGRCDLVKLAEQGLIDPDWTVGKTPELSLNEVAAMARHYGYRIDE